MLVGPAGAKERDGVEFAENVLVEGKTLVLNGRPGLRKRPVLFVPVKIYVIGLYVEHRSTDARAILTADRIKRVDLVMRRDLTGAEIGSGIADAINDANPTRKETLEAKIKSFQKLFPNVAAGERVSLTYVPGKGTTVAVRGADKDVIGGDDFAEALFSVWLGARPIQEDLKKDLLGL